LRKVSEQEAREKRKRILYGGRFEGTYTTWSDGTVKIVPYPPIKVPRGKWHRDMVHVLWCTPLGNLEKRIEKLEKTTRKRN